MKRENRVGTFGLGLEGIRVKSGRVVKHVQIMKPVQLMEHEPRTESNRSPLLEVFVDAFRLPAEAVPGFVQMPVVIQVMNSHLESIFAKPIAEADRVRIRSLGDEIERRPESEFHVESGQVSDLSYSFRGFNVMREYEGELLCPPATPSNPAA